jgi:hypothetical protein
MINCCRKWCSAALIFMNHPTEWPNSFLFLFARVFAALATRQNFINHGTHANLYNEVWCNWNKWSCLRTNRARTWVERIPRQIIIMQQEVNVQPLTLQFTSKLSKRLGILEFNSHHLCVAMFLDHVQVINLLQVLQNLVWSFMKIRGYCKLQKFVPPLESGIFRITALNPN